MLTRVCLGSASTRSPAGYRSSELGRRSRYPLPALGPNVLFQTRLGRPQRLPYILTEAKNRLWWDPMGRSEVNRTTSTGRRLDRSHELSQHSRTRQLPHHFPAPAPRPVTVRRTNVSNRQSRPREGRSSLEEVVALGRQARILSATPLCRFPTSPND